MPALVVLPKHQMRRAQVVGVVAEAVERVAAFDRRSDRDCSRGPSRCKGRRRRSRRRCRACRRCRPRSPARCRNRPGKSRPIGQSSMLVARRRRHAAGCRAAASAAACVHVRKPKAGVLRSVERRAGRADSVFRIARLGNAERHAASARARVAAGADAAIGVGRAREALERGIARAVGRVVRARAAADSRSPRRRACRRCCPPRRWLPSPAGVAVGAAHAEARSRRRRKRACMRSAWSARRRRRGRGSRTARSPVRVHGNVNGNVLRSLPVGLVLHEEAFAADVALE